MDVEGKTFNDICAKYVFFYMLIFEILCVLLQGPYCRHISNKEKKETAGMKCINNYAIINNFKNSFAGVEHS